MRIDNHGVPLVLVDKICLKIINTFLGAPLFLNRAGVHTMVGYHYPPWHFLYFLSLPQGHFSFRPILRPWATWSNLRCSTARASQAAQVHADPCSGFQLVRSLPITK